MMINSNPNTNHSNGHGNPDQITMVDFRHYISLLWHWTWLIVIATFIIGVVAFFISKQISPVYKATTTIYINEAPSTKTTDYTAILTSERLTRTYSQMMVKQPLLSEVTNRIGLTIDIDELSESISVQPVSDTQLIDITVESTNSLEAALIANSLVAVFAEQIQEMQTDRFSLSKQNLQTQLTDIDMQIEQLNNDLEELGEEDANEQDRLEARLSQQQNIHSTLLLSYEQVRLAEAEAASNVVQVEPALPPSDPVRPKVLTNTLLAALVGMVISVGTIFAVEALDDTLKNPDEVTQQLGLPILGIITHYPYEDGKPIAEMEPRSPVSEAFRTLRTNVQYASVDHPIKTILITSPAPSEGKTTVTTNLAVVLAQSGLRVAIIDADMRRPAVHRKLSLRNHIGLSSIFVRPSIILDGMMQKTRIANLSAITAGRLPPNPSELLGSQKMKKILEKVRQEADVILIDTPPTLAVTDAAVLVPVVDGVLLVMRPGATKLAAARQAVAQLQRIDANITGVVLNDIKINRSKIGYYYYRGYQGYSEYYSPESKKVKNRPRKVQ